MFIVTNSALLTVSSNYLLLPMVPSVINIQVKKSGYLKVLKTQVLIIIEG